MEVKIETPTEPEKIDNKEEIAEEVKKAVEEVKAEVEEKKIELSLETFKSELFSMFNSFATNIESKISNMQNTCESILTMEVLETEEAEEDPEPEPETIIEVTEEEKLAVEKDKQTSEKQKNNITLFGIIIAGLVIVLLAFGFKANEMNEGLEEDTPQPLNNWWS